MMIALLTTTSPLTPVAEPRPPTVRQHDRLPGRSPDEHHGLFSEAGPKAKQRALHASASAGTQFGTWTLLRNTQYDPAID